MDASINMISLFGFIVTLGIVVDAVVVGEEIFHNMSKGMGRMEAAIQGVRRMTTPVIFAVATNIIAFLPCFSSLGKQVEFFYALAGGGHCRLLRSPDRVPAHSSGSSGHQGKDLSQGWFTRFRQWQTRLRLRIDHWIDQAYQPVIEGVLRYRTLTCALKYHLVPDGARIHLQRPDQFHVPTFHRNALCPGGN